ncbi:hypothetical protein IFT36_06965 [Frigoribacterium sp. CFBP 13605]|uniref:hypothetical protein n=1 Tax=Frigoribacterium sp. CFBP 13605 TaxID=2774034 RepID=UPI001902CBAA|nr:hypothetical protein [Frigoribacterium sp. CFBP 13605]MBD8140286.1 hypothetical protein [Frigoribacterium sp. CFBP 13605]
MTQTIDTTAPDVVQFLDVFDDQMLAGDVGPRFTRSEVEALAGMLRAAEATAAAWIEGHSRGDDDIDDSTADQKSQRNNTIPPCACSNRGGYTFEYEQQPRGLES